MSKLLIDTLLAGIRSNPDDAGLKIHVARAYENESEPKSALFWYQKLLVDDASNTDYLLSAIRCAEAINDNDTVTAYRALLSVSQPSKNSSTKCDKTEMLSPQVEGMGSIEELNNDMGSNDKREQENELKPRVRGMPLKLVHSKNETVSDSPIEIEDSSIYLKDVGGMADVKKRLNLAFLAPLRNPELVKQYGKSLAGGLILYGPPGCGKTFIARALAGELGAKFISVSLSDILDMYIGESERKLHEVFETARQNTPTVLFFDELDAIGHKRSNLQHSGMRTLVNQLLNEMDSVNANNDGVFILGATNLPWDIDVALKRPGRFDRLVAVFPPDQEARQHILNFHLRNTPHDQVNVERLAQQSHLFSGADLHHLCQSAIEVVFEESLETGKARALTNSDFDTPFKEVKSSCLGWFESARNYAMFANKSGDFDDLLHFIEKNGL